MLFVRGEEGFRAPDRHPQSALRHLRRGRARVRSRDWILARTQQVFCNLFVNAVVDLRISRRGSTKRVAKTYYFGQFAQKEKNWAEGEGAHP